MSVFIQVDSFIVCFGKTSSARSRNINDTKKTVFLITPNLPQQVRSIAIFTSNSDRNQNSVGKCAAGTSLGNDWIPEVTDKSVLGVRAYRFHHHHHHRHHHNHHPSNPLIFFLANRIALLLTCSHGRPLHRRVIVMAIWRQCFPCFNTKMRTCFSAAYNWENDKRQVSEMN